MCTGPPLINGRGPLDGFLSRRSPAPSNENMVIDLTAESSLSPAKCLVSPALASPCLPTKGKHQQKDRTVSLGKSCNDDRTPKTQTLECTVVDKDEKVEEVEGKDGNHATSISQLELTQESESEPEEQNESGNVSSLGNKSMLSNSSVSSSSECSPEKTDDPSPTTTPAVCYISCSFLYIYSHSSTAVQIRHCVGWVIWGQRNSLSVNNFLLIFSFSQEPETTPKIPADQKLIKRRSLKV